MPAIRDKSLQSRRVGSMLNGLSAVGEFDQTDWSGEYEYDPQQGWQGDAVYADSATEVPSLNTNLLQNILSIGAQIFKPQQQSVQTSVPARQVAQQNNFTVPLLVAAGLAAVFILSRK